MALCFASQIFGVIYSVDHTWRAVTGKYIARKEDQV